MKFNENVNSANIISSPTNSTSAEEKKEKFNPLTEELLTIDISRIHELELGSRFLEITEESQVLQNNEIREILTHFIHQIKDKEDFPYIIRNNILNYLSEYRTQDPKTKERTLDRSYRILFELAEEFPSQVNSLFSGTHYMFEIVKPEVFFEVYSKLKNSDKLKNLKGPLLSQQFAQLEYNITYKGTERYIKALEDKIDFKNTKSCLESSQFINIAASLADYANSGSYSGNYDIGDEINKIFKEKGSDPKNIYLLGAKAEFISKRIDKGYPPFVHQNGIFELAPGILASNYKGELLITDLSNKEIQDNFETYKKISKEMDTPPKELVKRAVRLGLKEIDWVVDPDLRQLKEFYSEKIMKKMQNISEDNITLSKNTEVSKKQLIEYKNLVGTDFRDFLEEEFKIKFKNLKIPEQFFFLEYIQNQTLETVSRLKEFINNSNNKEDKINKFRTFLSIEQGGKEMGNKIISLGEKLSEDVARKVFAKYGEIVDTADNTQKILEDILPKATVDESQKEINEIKESMLYRAKELLSTFYEKKENNSPELLEDLERYKAEILLYADTYKKLKESGKEVKLEDIKNTQITILSQEEKEKMAKNFWNINKANRPFIKDGSEEMTNREKNFNLTIENTESDFYVLKHKDEVVAFCSFTPDENGDLYLESVNTESEAKNSHIGSEFLPIVLDKVKKLGKDIYGHVNALNPTALPYYKRLEFNISEIKENGELKYYEIRIPAPQQQVSNIAA